MGLFAWLREKVRKKVSGSGDAPAEQRDCAVDSRVEALRRSGAVIVDIDRRGGGPERTLTVVFYSGATGYFCVQQVSGGYTGLGFRYMMIPKCDSAPRAGDFVECADYSDWTACSWFSEAFELDFAGKERLRAPKLPGGIDDMSFLIELKKPGCSLKDGGLLERFDLYKNKYDDVKIIWSVGFGYSVGAHNPGAGGEDVVKADYFFRNDLAGFAKYVSGRYPELVTYNDIYNNSEIRLLFELCAGEA